MHQVSRFISDKRLPVKLQGRVVREMGAFYRRERQIRMDWAPLLNDMSKSLRTEVIQCIFKSVSFEISLYVLKKKSGPILIRISIQTLETSSFLQLLSTEDAKIDILAAGETLTLRPGQYVATYGYPTDYWFITETAESVSSE